MRKRIGIKNRMNQGHNGAKDSHEGKILFEAALGSQKNDPHGHPAMIKRKTHLKKASELLNTKS